MKKETMPLPLAPILAKAESELRLMGIPFNKLTLIRQKDGVIVWRVFTNKSSYVLKYFEKPEYRREITNYHILTALRIPTLKILADTDRALLMEDIENSIYRLGTVADVNNPEKVRLIAHWYASLHKNGYKYASTHSLYDECDSLTMENIKAIQKKTATSQCPVWHTLENHFTQIRSAAVKLPHTLTYNDFHYTNLTVARDGTSALAFDYNMLGKGYLYSDIRNVCESLGNEETRAAFLSSYGSFDTTEKIVDNVVSTLISLHNACQRKIFPKWAAPLVEEVKNGSLQSATEKLLETTATFFM